jgi:hypothetical protein
MHEAMTTARLIEPAGSGLDTERVMVTVPRTEVEEALRAEEPPDLMLEVARPAESGGAADWDTTTLTVRLDEAELERLLEGTDGSDIALGFDRDELAALLDEDVEAHGLREKAAVLTVVATTALGVGAGVASATVGLPEGGGGAQTALVGGAGPGGAVAAAGTEAPATSTGGAVPSSPDVVGGAAAAAGTESPAMTIGGASPSSEETIGGAVAAAGDESPAVAMGGAKLTTEEAIGGAVAAAGDQSPAQAMGGAVSPSTEPFGAVAASGGSSPAEATGLVGEVPTPTATDTGGGLSMPDAATGALAAAGAALLITGAGFVAVRRRGGTQPA